MVPSEGSGDLAHLQTPAPCLVRAFAGRSAPDGEQRASVRLTSARTALPPICCGHIDRCIEGPVESGDTSVCERSVATVTIAEKVSMLEMILTDRRSLTLCSTRRRDHVSTTVVFSPAQLPSSALPTM